LLLFCSTSPQRARRLAIGRSALYFLIGAGDLHVIHIGRAVRVPTDAIDASLRADVPSVAGDGFTHRVAGGRRQASDGPSACLRDNKESQPRRPRTLTLSV
jgi:hypothetical protein